MKEIELGLHSVHAPLIKEEPAGIDTSKTSKCVIQNTTSAHTNTTCHTEPITIDVERIEELCVHSNVEDIVTVSGNSTRIRVFQLVIFSNYNSRIFGFAIFHENHFTCFALQLGGDGCSERCFKINTFTLCPHSSCARGFSRF